MKNRLDHEEVLQVIKILEEIFPDARTELDYESHLDLLIATILSAQCTDVRVNIITKDLFKDLREPEDYLAIGQEELAERIKTCGFYNTKSKNIIRTCELLIENFGGQVPSNREDLMTLPGVGRKTANVVMSNLFGVPAIAVDTHVFRVSNRLGLVRAGNVEDTEDRLMEVLPEETWIDIHHRLILLGRRVCKARGPLCEECDLNSLCLDFNSGGK